MSMTAFVCCRNEIKHTVSQAELPLEVLDIKDWEKHGYGVFIELPDGELCKVLSVQGSLVLFVLESTGEFGHCDLKAVQ